VLDWHKVFEFLECGTIDGVSWIPAGGTAAVALWKTRLPALEDGAARDPVLAA